MAFDGSWMAFDGSWMAFDGSWLAFDGSCDVLALLRRSAMVWFVRRLYFINFNQFFSYIAKYRTFLSTRVYKK
jgi:hypothetical protein